MPAAICASVRGDECHVHLERPAVRVGLVVDLHHPPLERPAGEGVQRHLHHLRVLRVGTRTRVMSSSSTCARITRFSGRTSAICSTWSLTASRVPGGTGRSSTTPSIGVRSVCWSRFHCAMPQRRLGHLQLSLELEPHRLLLGLERFQVALQRLDGVQGLVEVALGSGSTLQRAGSTRSCSRRAISSSSPVEAIFPANSCKHRAGRLVRPLPPLLQLRPSLVQPGTSVPSPERPLGPAPA